MDGRDYTEDVKSSGQDKENDKGDDKYKKVCYMCRKPESKVSSVISIPGGMNLYRDCIQKAFDSVTKGGMGFSRFPNMPHMSMNLDNLNVTPPAVGIPGEQKIGKKSREQSALTMRDIPTLHVIKGKLDEYAIGQEKAKRVVSVAVYNHYKHTFLDGKAGRGEGNAENTEPDDMVIEKSSILMTGPTGSGKTYLVKTLARFSDVPLVITDATSLAEAGYIGNDIESMVSKLLAIADNDVERTQRGIIFIDEIGKIAKKEQINTRDANGESMRQGLLKLLEGSTMEVPMGSNQRNAMTPTATASTGNILSICGGVFPDLEKIIKERLKRRSSMGFGSVLRDTYNSDPNILNHVINENLRTFGMIPEFLRRLPVTATLQGLIEDMMVCILKGPRNAVTKRYEELLSTDEVRLVLEDDALMWITEEALKRGTGARALRAILEGFMLDIMYEILKNLDTGSIMMTCPYLEKDGRPLVQMRG